MAAMLSRIDVLEVRFLHSTKSNFFFRSYTINNEGLSSNHSFKLKEIFNFTNNFKLEEIFVFFVDMNYRRNRTKCIFRHLPTNLQVSRSTGWDQTHFLMPKSFYLKHGVDYVATVIVPNTSANEKKGKHYKM